MNLIEVPSLVKLLDEGLQKEIDLETENWNKRENLERFPLSPSQFGKCALALGRNLSHYLGFSDHPRSNTALLPRIKRVFSRGHALEALLIEDIEKLTNLKVIDKQKEITLFTLRDGREIKGSIDGRIIFPDGTTATVDFKSKGAFYSSGFQDSITQFFKELQQTGFVKEIGTNAYYITDPKALFDAISLDDFFVDYLLQLNGYGMSTKDDFVMLYYENKNTCANYEVRWKPVPELLQYAQEKFQFIYDSVMDKKVEEIGKEFALGSSRCRLCDFNELCYGKYTPPQSRHVGELGARLDKGLRESRANGGRGSDRIDEEVLLYMQQNDLSHVQTSDGLMYERKFLKSPKPRYELRLSK